MKKTTLAILGALTCCLAILIFAAPACHTSAGALTPIGQAGSNLETCAATEAQAAASGTSILDIVHAIETAYQAYKTGGLAAVEADLGPVFMKYGSPIAWCEIEREAGGLLAGSSSTTARIAVDPASPQGISAALLAKYSPHP